MRVLRAPHQGFLADHDMIAYYPAWQSSAATWTNQTTTLGRLGADRHLIAANGLFPASEVASLFDPDRPLGGWYFDGTVAMASQGSTNNDSSYISNASVGFSAAFWYQIDSTSTVVVLERSVVPGGTTTNAVLLQLQYFGASTPKQFGLRITRDTGVVQEIASPPVPTGGFFGFEIAEARQVRFYSNGVQVGSTTTLSAAVSAVAATATSARWFVGGSLNNVSGGSFGSFPTDKIVGTLSEVALWRRPIGPTRMRTAYAGCVQPWHADDLINSENHVVRTRVLLEDTNGVLQNLSDLDGRDWVREVSCEKDVDDTTATAQISLHRRMGRLADLSPLNTLSSDYTDMLALRRKVRIERAIVPVSWNMVGWEWEPIFEGFVDSWSMTSASVEVTCSDRSAALNDAFILENRAYNFSPTKVAEEVLDQIVDDFEPTIRRGGGASAVVVGYKGFPSRPKVYTEAGTVTTPTFVDSRFMLRYNDVGSGPVMSALQAVADQIGYAVEYRYHEPWAEHRLTMYSPRRTKQIFHETIRQIGPQEVMVEFREPHGLSENMFVDIGGTGSVVDTTYSAASIMDFYRVGLRRISAATIGSGSGASVGSAGTVNFTHNDYLSPENVLDLTPAKSDIGRIRNHAIVRFNRNESSSTLAPSSIDVASGIINVNFTGSVGNIDPSGNGIAFSLVGGTSTATALNGSYSGYVDPSGSLVVSDVPGVAPDGTYTTNLPIFASVHLNYREVVSTATASMNEYGYLPVAVFEGSGLAINTEAEATRLAKALVSDLATPTVEFSFISKVRPYEIHDIIRIPVDSVKGRWTDYLVAAITGITERYSGGRAEGEYRIRLDQPSRGTAWIERIVVTPNRPAPGSNNLSNIVDQASRWKLSDAARNARRFQFNRQLPQRREMGLRHDQTMIWMSTGSVGFIPTEDNRVGVFKGERFAIDADGQGRSLRPGTTYYVRFGEVDVFGNVSAISGLGIASTATVPSFVPRFADETMEVLAVNVTGATFTVSVGDWFTSAPKLELDDAGDDAGISLDEYNAYSAASAWFTAPCDGTFALNHVSSWFGDPIKVTASQTWYMLAGWLHDRNGATLGFYGENGVEGVGSTVLYPLTASAQVTCSSGDRLLLMWKNASATGRDVIFAAGSTASTNYGLVSYSLVHQVTNRTP